MEKYSEEFIRSLQNLADIARKKEPEVKTKLTNQKLIWYRDMFWSQMVEESLGKEALEKLKEHVKDRLFKAGPAEFALFNSDIIGWYEEEPMKLGLNAPKR